MVKYPRFTLRLSNTTLQKLDAMARIRSRTRGQVVREAIDFYFVNRFPTSEPPPKS